MEYRLFDLVQKYQPHLETPIPAALARCGIFATEIRADGNHIYGQEAEDLLRRVCSDEPEPGDEAQAVQVAYRWADERTQPLPDSDDPVFCRFCEGNETLTFANIPPEEIANLPAVPVTFRSDENDA